MWGGSRLMDKGGRLKVLHCSESNPAVIDFQLDLFHVVLGSNPQYYRLSPVSQYSQWICIGNHTTLSSIWKYFPQVGFSKSIKIAWVGRVNAVWAFWKHMGANYFQIKREKSYDFFLIRYITKLQSKFRFGSDACIFTPPKQKIWLVLTKPYCLVANQKR